MSVLLCALPYRGQGCFPSSPSNKGVIVVVKLPFTVHQCNRDELKALLAEASITPKDKIEREIEGKKQFDFLCAYLSKLDCKTIVAEYFYLDKDYSSDYSGYYVHSFHTYRKFCTRLHFFTRSFDDVSFENTLCEKGSKNAREELNTSYCGFIVVKPLRRTMIGRTCLKVYPPDGGQCSWPTKREYKASLYGIPLEIKTLAFQEQDGGTAACATSAVWSVLQKTGCLFHHDIMSPIAVTQAATLRRPPAGPIFPNDGLDIGQVADAIRSVGLEALVIENPGLSESGMFREIVYAYLAMGIPVFLGVDLVDTEASPKSKGLHAIAITGYSLKESAFPAPNEEGFRSFASDIDILHAHDDRVGPFAPFSIEDTPIKIQDMATDDVNTHNVSLCVWTSKGSPESERAIPKAAVIPLYSKIRVGYLPVRRAVERFEEMLTKLLAGDPIPFPKLKWRIFLSKSNDIKEDVRKCDPPPAGLLSILTQSMPRYVWRAQGLHHDQPMIEVFFDATEAQQGFSFFRPICYDPKVFYMLRGISQGRT